MKPLYKVHKLALAFVLSTAFTAQAHEALSLTQALGHVRTHHIELALARAQAEQVLAMSQKIDGAFDIKLKDSLIKSTTEKNQPSSLTIGKTDATIHEFSVSKLFAYGTHLEVKAKHQNANYETKSIPPLITGEKKEDYTGEYSMKLAQPLWRNWLGKELRLQKAQLAHKALGPKSGLAITQQVLQSQIEKLYWQLAGALAQKNLNAKLLKVLKRFEELMAKSHRVGRISEVEIAGARARTVAHESILLDLDIAVERLTTLIRHAVYGDSTVADILAPNLHNPPLPLPAKGRTACFELAIKQRLDLEALKNTLTEQQLGLAVVKEQGKPHAHLFWEHGTFASTDSLGKTVSEPLSTYTPSNTFGISLSMTLGDTANKAEARASMQAIAHTNLQREKLMQNLRKDLDLAFLELESAERQRLQLGRQIKSLKAERASARKLFLQARTSEAAVTKYEIEILMAQSKS